MLNKFFGGMSDGTSVVPHSFLTKSEFLLGCD